MRKWIVYNEREFCRRLRELDRLHKEATLVAQEKCPHIAGSNPLSEQTDYHGRTSIVWHTLPTKETVGICLNCQRQFWSTDADYDIWKNKPSFCRASSGVDRNLGAPMAASDSIAKIDVPIKVALSTEYNEKWGW